MARRLPWLRGNDNAKRRVSPKRAKSLTARPAKRTRIHSPSPPLSDSLSDTSTAATSIPIARHPLIQSATNVRSPSTSPPPLLPPTDLMRPGLDADDIYIMVEDEFQSIAQFYTQHLHHAEYKRLKRLARSHRAEESARISRPTVGGEVSKERSMQKAQEDRTERANAAITGTGVRSKGGCKVNARETSDEGDSDIEVMRDDDPWVGTTLQSLMTIGSGGSKSLVGLQGISANTRAAAGLGRQKKAVDLSRTYDLDGKRGEYVKDDGHVSVETETASDSDDLDRPLPATQRHDKSTLAVSRRTRLEANKVSIRTPSPAIYSLRDVGHRDMKRGPDILPRPRSVLKSRCSSVQETALMDDMCFMRPKTAPIDRAKTQVRLPKVRDNKQGSGNVDEIPVFLV